MRKLVFTLLVILSFCNLGFAQKTIEPELLNVLNQKGDEMISVNIILKSQVNFDELQNRAKNINDKETRRNVLVNELKIFAEKEQQEILSILKAEEKSNEVSDINPRWMTNYINCTATRDVIYLLAEHPDVLIIGYNQEKYLLWDEDSEETVLKGTTLTENITKVNADDVWDLGFTGHGVVVAVIDTGVNYDHVDLADHLWDGGYEFPNHGYNTYYNNDDPMDNFGHGTHCAGTVCGDGTSGTKTGIAPNASLMCVKALNDEGGGSVDHINEGIEWAIEHHADVLSLSLGIPTSTITERTILRRTCETAMELNVVAAVACGNEGNMQWMNPIPDNVRVPGSCPPPWLHPDQANANPGDLSCVVSVGAVNYYDAAADFSSHGPVTWQATEFGDYPYQPGIGLIRPDVCAPGVNIVSLDFATNDGHATMSGTSMATPCVAGVMALMMEKKNDLTPAEICMILETTAAQLTPTKSNITGSGRIDALAAIEAIESGDFEFINYVIDDKENGNGNNNLNALEEVCLNVTFKNKSEESFNNVTAVLRTNNILVRLDDSIAQINHIAANETLTITDSFRFLVDETADYTTLIGFDVLFYDENEELVSFFRVPVQVKDNVLQFASVIIENDNNGNGILEAGETADFGVVLNNIGNELAVDLSGILSCDDNDITINTNEASFSSIGEESSAVAFFNVTLSDDASDTFSIPFELTAKDSFNNEHELSFDYANACNIVFELKDDYGDGWDGAAIVVKYSDGTPDEAFTVNSGHTKTYTRQISSGVEVTLEWSKGSWDIECSFVIKKENGGIIYSDGGRFIENGFLFSWTNDCASQNNYYETCDAVQNLEYIASPTLPVEIAWDAPVNGDPIHYEIYRNEKFLGTTEELNYIDETATGTFLYVYSVRPVFEDCYGAFQTVVVEFVEFVDENQSINVSVFPNPSKNDFTIVCDSMTRISVYNIMGTLIKDYNTNDNRFVINGLDNGIYFFNIETGNGNIVRKVVKL